MMNVLDSSHTPRERARDLLSRLSVEQKISQLFDMMITGDPDEALAPYPDGVGEVVVARQTRSPEDAAELHRQIIDARLWLKPAVFRPVLQVEAISGLLGPGATSFPTAIGLAATFNPDAVREMTEIIRGQMLATGIRRALSPVMDVSRDPRWGAGWARLTVRIQPCPPR